MPGENLIREPGADDRVLLTGHTGFKGSWLALWLHHLGAEVTGIARASSEHRLFRLLCLDELVQTRVADIRDANALAGRRGPPGGHGVGVRQRRQVSPWTPDRCGNSISEVGTRAKRTAKLAEYESLKYGMFIHFGMSTFTGSEFGAAHMSPETCAPLEPRCEAVDSRGERSGHEIRHADRETSFGVLRLAKRRGRLQLKPAAAPPTSLQSSCVLAKGAIKPGLYYAILNRATRVGLTGSLPSVTRTSNSSCNTSQNLTRAIRASACRGSSLRTNSIRNSGKRFMIW